MNCMELMSYIENELLAHCKDLDIVAVRETEFPDRREIELTDGNIMCVDVHWYGKRNNQEE